MSCAHAPSASGSDRSASRLPPAVCLIQSRAHLACASGCSTHHSPGIFVFGGTPNPAGAKFVDGRIWK